MYNGEDGLIFKTLSWCRKFLKFDFSTFPKFTRVWDLIFLFLFGGGGQFPPTFFLIVTGCNKVNLLTKDLVGVWQQSSSLEYDLYPSISNLLLCPGSAHTRPSVQPPINTSRKVSVWGQTNWEMFRSIFSPFQEILSSFLLFQKKY